MPDFSVLLSIYFKEKTNHFRDSMSSIWFRQSLKPSQIVLVKDGPLTLELDAEVKYWEKVLSDVLTVVSLPENSGLAVALNRGLQYCKYDLVARMDTDDIAKPDRFKLQVEFMQKNKNIAVSSCHVEEWDANFNCQLSSRILPPSHDALCEFAKTRSPISHPACIFRKSVVLSVGGYPNLYPEDYLLWVRVLQAGYKLANIPLPLLSMRTGDDFIARRGYDFLKGELKCYHIMYKDGFISLQEFLKAALLRTIVRLVPNFLKIWFYKRMR